MIHTKLQYHRPTEIAQTCAILAEHVGDVAVLGGGTWLLPRLHRHEVSVSHIVDLRGLGLNGIEVRNNDVEVGAMVTYSDVLASPDLAREVPLLPRVARGITGGNQLRNQGTWIGSACYANPSSEAPAALVSLDAKLKIASAGSVRVVDARDFFVGAFRTALQPGEIVVSFVAPRRRAQVGYYKLKVSEGSWPIATAAAVRDQATGRTAVTLGAVAARPLRIELDELREPDGRLRVGDVAEYVRARVTEPWSDVLADGNYRREVSGVVARRAIDDLQREALQA